MRKKNGIHLITVLITTLDYSMYKNPIGGSGKLYQTLTVNAH